MCVVNATVDRLISRLTLSLGNNLVPRVTMRLFMTASFIVLVLSKKVALYTVFRQSYF